MNGMDIKTAPRKSDKFIPLYFVAFFLCLFAIDGFMAYLAVSTHTGVIEKDAYERGVNYNATLAEKARQKESGWSSVIALTDGHVVVFDLTGAQGEKISGAAVTAQVIRPTSEGEDFTQALSETETPGHYMAAIPFPEKGVWEIRIRAEKDGVSYKKYKRVVLER
ncbi:MAG: hypothetical protein EP349_00205 [Alphaproteobacteria bacterium]|nr:MAG: hypothetical protein EP349_00205 [Alphaproteobacteria bacterium]